MAGVEFIGFEFSFVFLNDVIFTLQRRLTPSSGVAAGVQPRGFRASVCLVPGGAVTGIGRDKDVGSVPVPLGVWTGTL